MATLKTAKASELQAGGEHLAEPGLYHLCIENIRVGLSTKDKPINGNTIECEVMAGTAKDCQHKKLNLVLWNTGGENTSESGEKLTERRQTAFYLAVNSLKPEQLGQEVDIDEERPGNDSEQFLCKLSRRRKKNDNGDYVDDPQGGLEFHFDDIWHVDDPAAAEVPKFADALALIPKSKRHAAAWFAFKDKSGGAGKGKPAANGSKQTKFDPSDI